MAVGLFKAVVRVYDEVRQADFVGGFEHDGSFYDVFQFADVAGPGVSEYFFGGQFCEAFDFADFSGTYSRVVDEIFSQQGYVFLS